eukprot:471304-Amphidinium_carterae.1
MFLALQWGGLSRNLNSALLQNIITAGWPKPVWLEPRRLCEHGVSHQNAQDWATRLKHASTNAI